MQGCQKTLNNFEFFILGLKNLKTLELKKKLEKPEILNNYFMKSNEFEITCNKSVVNNNIYMCYLELYLLQNTLN